MALSETVIKLAGISKCYKKVKVLENVSLQVERGHVLGLIGPNGAGKTTIFKLLAGLTIPDDGKISLFGSEQALNESRRKMSVMIEQPALDPLMTATENMKYVCYIKNMKNADIKIREVLTLVGLRDTGKKQVKNFSLGMKQRLGLGIALLNDPEILILDEPMNGLDPEGIAEFRCLLKKMVEQRKATILISSHILSEVEEVCTDYAIINGGRLIESASMVELAKKRKRHLVIAVNDLEKACNIINEKFETIEYQLSHDGEIYLYNLPEDTTSVFKAIMDAGISISKFSCEEESLERYYLSKVGATQWVN